MKISKKYVLYINRHLGVATFGTSKFNHRLSDASRTDAFFGKIFDCNLSELKHNLKYLMTNDYSIRQSKS